MEHQTPFGLTRTTIKHRHALITPDGYVPSDIPGWEGVEFNVVISKAMGANLTQWFARLDKDHGGQGDTEGRSLFMYVVEGKAKCNEHNLGAGQYIYLPPATTYSVKAMKNSTRLLMFEKTYEPMDGVTAPPVTVGDQAKVAGEPFLGDPDAMLQNLLPEDDPAFDMAVNIFTYQPGATLPFVETHIMEHGLMMTHGQGVYRLEDEYYPVKEGDVIWMAPYCPQWYVSMGKTTSGYIYYKDVGRYPRLS